MRILVLVGVGFVSLSLGLPPAMALEQSPIVKLDASGGQVFMRNFSGTSKSFSGSAAVMGTWLFSDGLRLSEDDTLIPTVSGQFMRRAQVNQLGGGATVISKTLDDAASMRWVHSFGPWALKPNASYKNEMLTISGQERLGAGIFDSSQGQAGLEAEWKGEAFKSVRGTFSAAKTRYYHYEIARSPLFGAELLSDYRDLDSTSFEDSVAADFVPWENGLLSASVAATYLVFPHQVVFRCAAACDTTAPSVKASGNRWDILGTATAGLTQRWSGRAFGQLFEGSLGASGGFTDLYSKQNDFDNGQAVAGRPHFNWDYYSYREHTVGPVAMVSMNRRWSAFANYTYTRRVYRHRPVQDVVGNYIGGRISTASHSAAFSLSCVLGKGFGLHASGGYTYQTSNALFETFYLYRYSYPFYFAGVSYAL